METPGEVVLAKAEKAKKNNDAKAEKCEIKADKKTDRGLKRLVKILEKFREKEKISSDDADTLLDIIGKMESVVVE